MELIDVLINQRTALILKKLMESKYNAAELSNSTNIPIAMVYKILKNLQKNGLAIIVEKKLTQKQYPNYVNFYRSNLKAIKISIERDQEIKIEKVINNGAY
jgi:transcription initiation factor IIE alpha subunit